MGKGHGVRATDSPLPPAGYGRMGEGQGVRAFQPRVKTQMRWSLMAMVLPRDGLPQLRIAGEKARRTAATIASPRTGGCCKLQHFSNTFGVSYRPFWACKNRASRRVPAEFPQIFRLQDGNPRFNRGSDALHWFLKGKEIILLVTLNRGRAATYAAMLVGLIAAGNFSARGDKRYDRLRQYY